MGGRNATVGGKETHAMPASKLRRRDVLRGVLGGIAGLAGFPTIVPSRAGARSGRAAPSDRIVLGCIGTGRMGTHHVRGFLQHADVRVAAVCDVRRDRRERAKGIVNAHYGDRACGACNDFRELLGRSDVDAVMIATPEHWHSLIGIEAARRGKHMYYEKPMSITVAEAKAVREAVDRYGRVFQFGTQQRSSRDYRQTCELVRNGRIGELRTILIGSAGGGYGHIPPQRPQPVPDGFDYDLWLGPAPWAPYSDARVSLEWLFISDYGLGCLDGAWGIHDVDAAQWINGSDDTAPVTVEGRGRFFDGMRDTPYSWEVEHRYANGVRLIHMDMLTARKRAEQFSLAHHMASVFVGTKGWIYVSRQGMHTHPSSLRTAAIGPGEVRVIRSNDHRRNFLDAIRTGRRTVSPVEAAVRAETICQQAHIALKLRRKLRWDPVGEAFVDDGEADRMLSKAMRSPWRL